MQRAERPVGGWCASGLWERRWTLWQGQTERSGCGCAWHAPTRQCRWAYDLAIALSEIADLIQGSWIAVESAGECIEGGDHPCYWTAETATRANATCVNNLINAAVAHHSAAAAQCWKGCGLTPNYPRLPSDCWVRCLQMGVLGPEPRLGNGTGEAAVDPRILTAAFERGMQVCKLRYQQPT